MSQPSECEAMRTAIPLETLQFPEDPSQGFIHPNPASYLLSYKTLALISGRRLSRHKVTLLRAQHSEDRQLGGPHLKT